MNGPLAPTMSPDPPRLELGSSDLAAAVELAGGDLGWTIEDVADLFLGDGLAAEDADPSPPPQNFQEVVCAEVKSLGCTVFADMLGALDGSRIVTAPPPLKRLVVFVPSDEALAAQPAVLRRSTAPLCASHTWRTSRLRAQPTAPWFTWTGRSGR